MSEKQELKVSFKLTIGEFGDGDFLTDRVVSCFREYADVAEANFKKRDINPVSLEGGRSEIKFYRNGTQWIF